jgi:hypothetical protein
MKYEGQTLNGDLENWTPLKPIVWHASSGRAPFCPSQQRPEIRVSRKGRHIGGFKMDHLSNPLCGTRLQAVPP